MASQGDSAGITVMADTEWRISRPVTVPAARGAAWLSEGFAMVQREWLAWIGVTLVFFILSIAVPIFVPFGSVLFNLVIFALLGGLMLGCRDIERGAEFNIAHLFSGFTENLGQYILLGVIYLIAVGIILLLMGILVFVMVGGMNVVADLQSGDLDKLLQYSATILVAALLALLLYLPLIMAFWFAPALVALGKVNALEAMKLSFAGCMANVMPYLVYGLVYLILSLLATIPLGLGWFILCPVTVASIYLSYRDIFESGKEVTPDQY